MKPTYDFTGKTVFVTGAGSGLGRGIAKAFAQAGAKVMLGDVSEQGGHAVLDEIKSKGGHAAFVHCDVTRSDQIQEAIQEAVHMFGSLDIAVNNAGIATPLLPLAEVPEEEFDKLMGINLTGVYKCMKYELPQMLEQGSGVILNMASALGLTILPQAAPYVASKFGVVGLTRTAAVEYAKKNIRINAICPGFIDTPLLAVADEETRHAMSSIHPMGRIGKVSEVSDLALWLASDAASLVTGAAYAVDAGWTAS